LKQLLALLMCCFFIACNKKMPENENKIVGWYNKAQSFRQKQPDSILYYGQLIDSAANNNITYQAMAAICKGLYYSAKATYQLSLNQYTKAHNLLKTNGPDSLIAKSLAGLGATNGNLGNDAVALDNLLNALRISEKSNNKELVAGIYSQIGQDYQLKGDIVNSKFYVHEGLKTVSDKPTSNAYLLTLHTLANIYGMSNMIDSALLIDAQGLAFANTINAPSITSMFYDNKANCFVELKKFDSAFYYFNKSLLIDSVGGNFKQVSDSYLNLGIMFSQQKKYNESINYLTHSIKLANATSYLYGKQNAWAMLAESYTAQQNFANALIAKDSATSIKDQLINEKSSSKIAELRELYQAEKKEQTIQLQQSEISKQKIIIIGIAALLISLIFTGYSYIKKQKIKKEIEIKEQLHQQQQQATINILQAEEKERGRIASDLHDGVGQLMMAAWLNLQALEHHEIALDTTQKDLLQKSIILVDESCKEVRSVSHSMMPNALLKKGLLNAIKDFIQQIDKNVININLQTDGLQIQLPTHVEAILYRIIQESVNNVVKHANATALDISINNDATGTDVLIEDNGKGFDVQAALQKDGIGLQNIKNRIDYLKGTVHWDSSEGNGTVVSIFIPSII
jgi:two-component system, NarL family, sensor kinase